MYTQKGIKEQSYRDISVIDRAARLIWDANAFGSGIGAGVIGYETMTSPDIGTKVTAIILLAGLLTLSNTIRSAAERIYLHNFNTKKGLDRINVLDD